MEISTKVNDMIFNQVKSDEQIIVARAMEKLNEIKRDYNSGNGDNSYIHIKVPISFLTVLISFITALLYFTKQISIYFACVDLCIVIIAMLVVYILTTFEWFRAVTTTKMPLVYNKNLSSTDEYRLKMIIENPKIQSQHDAFHNVINWIIGIPLLKLPTEIVERDLVTSYNKISYLGDFNSLFELEKAQAVLLKTFKDKL